MYLKLVYPHNESQDYYVQIMMIGEQNEYYTYQVVQHPCQVRYIKEMAFQNWAADIDHQKVCRGHDNNTLEEMNNNHILVNGAKYMIIYILHKQLTTKYDYEKVTKVSK